jgi:phosphomethylpyrimidine synthase
MPPSIAIMVRNKKREISPLRISQDSPTRIFVNLGLPGFTPAQADVDSEHRKAIAAVEAGADAVLDLSISGEIGDFRRSLLKELKVPIGTVPIYEAFVNALRKRGSFVKVSEDEIVRVIEQQAEEGVDIMTLHAAFTREVLDRVRLSHRIMPIPSRGGSWLAGYMIDSGKENPLYSRFDELLDILKHHGVTLSIGAAVRPGSIVDGLDDVFLSEMIVQGQLVERALAKGVQTMVEGVGHVRADAIPVWVGTAKQLCHNVPLRVLPLPTDVASAHDHVAGAIAGTIAALNGVEVLCCVTRAEHLGFPRLEDTREAVVAFRIAAHVADLVKTQDYSADESMSRARSSRKWQEMWRSAIDGHLSAMLYDLLKRDMEETDRCTMCGELCAHRIIEQYMKNWKLSKS